jgi:acetoin utilization deacetylase AcuC-like enzyme/GNAT superfamily N-acetyltransferase
MFRIRRVADDLYPMNRHAVKQVKEIMRSQFSGLKEEKIQAISEQLHNPLKFRFRPTLFVADNNNGMVKAFALLLYAPDRHFCFLDFIATRKEDAPGGIGSALYERCREEALLFKANGIYMECLPDDPRLCQGSKILDQNAARLRFYERFGARPIVNTLYETPVKEDDTCPPFLVFDNLDRKEMPTARQLKQVVEAILRRKYGDYCPDDYIAKVVDSIIDDPINLRPARYIRESNNRRSDEPKTSKKPVPLVYNQNHQIHHVKEKGYVEAPVRISVILKAFEGTDLVKAKPVRFFPEKHIRQVHNPDLVDFLKEISAATPEGRSVYPYIFPIRNPNRKPKELEVQTGYYCIDTFTPIHRNVWEAARTAVDCALTCADEILQGEPLCYALVRPPGHHAERNVYGGFCYLNTSAIAANYLSHYGKVAILDIDYHHGNGQQEIFYKRADVLTISLHGKPSTTYPYFAGYRKEKGEDEGLGFNHNFPLPDGTTPQDYRKVLSDALKLIEKFDPSYIVVACGLDTAKGDPTGSFNFTSKDFEKNGRMIGSLRIPTLVVQEGGYLSKTLGTNAQHFIKGLHDTVWK